MYGHGKKTIIKTNASGSAFLDSNGKEIIINFERYVPNFASLETWLAILFIISGIFVLLGLEKYGEYRRQKK